MNFNLISAGEDIPNNVYAIIEISSNSFPIKYEINKINKCLFVDRFLNTSMHYPTNYGYINKTISEDGDPLDILVITEFPLLPLSIILCRPIGMLKMQDEKGNDMKIIAVPDKKITNLFDHINNINDLSYHLQNKIKHFFQQYKNLDNNSWAIVNQFVNEIETKSEIIKAINRYKTNS